MLKPDKFTEPLGAGVDPVAEPKDVAPTEGVDGEGDGLHKPEAVGHRPELPRLVRLPFSLSGRQWRLLIVGVIIAIAVTAILERERLTDAEHIVDTLGYPGIFILALTGSGALVIPIPSAAAIFIGGIFLTPVYVGLIAGAAEGIGEITGYALGYSGQSIVENNRFYRRVEVWLRKRGWLAIIVFAAIPNPVFDVIGLAAGVLRYPLRRFLFYVWIGKTIKNVGLAYAGFLGATWLGDLFNISVTRSS